MITGLDHVNIDTDDLDGTIAFYQGVLDLDPRPKPSGSPGVWLYSGDTAVVHVNVVEGPSSLRQSPRDRAVSNINHVAFRATDLDATVASLVSANVAHQVNPRPDMGLTLVNFEDPNHVPIELTIPL